MLSRGISTFSCVERVKEYIENKQFEGQISTSPLEITEIKRGTIDVKSINVRYRDGLPFVLKNLSFSIDENQKIGIIGRTGSGKSTFLLCLMRILEIAKDESGKALGKIEIDGIDISTLGLYFLRKNLVVIPQDPFLLEGSLRHNIDPTSEFSDIEVMNALDKVEFWSTLKKEGKSMRSNQTINSRQGLDKGPEPPEVTAANKRSEQQSGQSSSEWAGFKDLKMYIEKNGDNLSQGQRQLICIARALVQNPKILLMDEATSSLDHRTNDIIQKVIKYHLEKTTVLTIAHRLMTVIQYDKLIVLKNGNKVEEGSPSYLIEKQGYFWSLINEGESDFVQKMKYLAKHRDMDIESINNL